MSKIFGGLFTQAQAEPDGYTQTQREAIVDLLNFCMCADDKLRPIEDRFITHSVARLSWEGAQNFESFSATSIERAGAALKSFTTRAGYLASIAERLSTTEAKSDAIALCQQIFHVDGEFPDSERVIFREIRHVFGWPV